MTIGVGGSNAEKELTKLGDMATDVSAVTVQEFQGRIEKAKKYMQQQGMDAVYLNAGTNLYYFTGTRWYPSERMVGALLTSDGQLHYIAPYFEVGTLTGHMQIQGQVHAWHEQECPYRLFAYCVNQLGLKNGRIGLDESTPFFISNGLAQANPYIQFLSAKSILATCRMKKSNIELALLQRAKEMTLEVQKAAARTLYEGISTDEVVEFINEAHRSVGVSGGSYFCIVLFGQDSAFPHGVKQTKNLEKDDMVLIDTGCQLQGYHSDITRSYVFGKPNALQRKIWSIEKQSQQIAFENAQLGVACGDIDFAAREYLAQQGLGPDYDLPGLPHRTGHGIGLDIHEWPYLVSNDTTPLDVGMCFSNEPAIYVPGEFGVRLEDHFYMTAQGAKWFTQPSYSIDDPFGYQI